MKVRMKVGAAGGGYHFENGLEYTDAEAPPEMLRAFVEKGFAVLIEAGHPAPRKPKSIKKISYEHREMRVADGEEEA